MMARPRPKIVSLTDAAAARVKEIMAASDKPYLRVGVKNGGCAGMEYVMAYADDPAPFDERVEDRGVEAPLADRREGVAGPAEGSKQREILVDAKAVLFLIGATIDYETTRLASRFVFKNPNQTDACGCGESVTIVPAREEA